MKHLKSYKGLSKLTKMVSDINFNKEEKGYRIGLDDFYSQKLKLHELKELSNFLVDYIKEQENTK